MPPQPVTPDTVAWLTGDSAWTQADLLERAAVQDGAEGERLLTDLHPAAAEGVDVFPRARARGKDRWSSCAAPARAPGRPAVTDERTTAEVRDPAQPPSL